MIRTEWQADAEIAPLVGAEQAVVHKLIAEGDIAEAHRWLARLPGDAAARPRWEARLAEAQARLQDAQRRLSSVH
ncbi:hypothetical protein [Microcystis phage Mwe-JY26]